MRDALVRLAAAAAIEFLGARPLRRGGAAAEQAGDGVARAGGNGAARRTLLVWGPPAVPQEVAVALLARCLGRLPREELLVLSLRYEQGLTWPEVAAASGHPRGQARRLHDGALRRLERMLPLESPPAVEGGVEAEAAAAAGQVW